MDKVILLVDDEAQVLKALVRTLIDTEYQVITAGSGAEALELLEKNRIDLVMSDMRMPNMDGYDLLMKIKEKYPSILRIILSGYSDESVVFRALQRNIAKLYIFKPWENDKLIKLIEQLFETEELLKNSNLLALVNDVEQLPTIKTNFQRILESIENGAEMSEISRYIEHDQSISTKILQIANSAYYGVKTGSIRQAITYLGLSNVRSLVMSASIVDSFNSIGIPDRIMQDIWKHAFVTNKILSVVYEMFLRKKIPETAMSAGLLHNIGTVLLIYIFKSKYLKCLNDAERNKINIIEMERQNFGVNHNEAGGYLLKWWELPFPIVEAALYHHDPFNDNIINKELLHAIHISEEYSWSLLKRKQQNDFKEETFNVLGIEKIDFEEKLASLDLL